MRNGQLEAAATILASSGAVTPQNRDARIAEAAGLAQRLYEKLYGLPDVGSVMYARDQAERDATYCREQWVAQEKRCAVLVAEVAKLKKALADECAESGDLRARLLKALR